MDRAQLQTVILVIIWGVVGLAGVSFLRSAFRDRTMRRNSKLAAAMDEVRFRLRLAFGVLLLILVASGFIWMVTTGAK